MDTLIFATNNQHKVEEVREVLGKRFEIITLKEAGMDIDIPEPYDTLEANASEKSKTIYELTQKNCFSEDTGLEVSALNGEPGVKSARYAGEPPSFKANIEKLLSNMDAAQNREARFRTVISLIIDKKEFQFEGICEGEIICEERGQSGFGYDPVFIPKGSTLTFAEMDMKQKSIFSHRKKAMDKLISFLRSGE
ncbi:MAG: nucleoside 5-triphosphatase RdgB [Ferruginibacter sp.]|nr:nucleoside 5-triphosphatase RdgB [Ferruginibacter sp.]